MSRIHDALKKAEEDKLAGKVPPHDPPADSPLTVTSDTADRQAPDVRPAPPVFHPNPTDAVPHQAGSDTFLQQCTKATWRPDPKKALFIGGDKQLAPGMEEFRTLRARLFQLRAKKPLKSVLITSALPGEGKSFVSSNLAQVLARQRGSKTLLIDCDLRKPQLHEVFGAPSSPGLADYLLGKVSERSIVQKSNYEDLFFIPGGEVGALAPELIGNGRMKMLLDSLAPLFSWIIIDSSPTVPVSDASRLAEVVDGVVMVIRAGSTPASLAEKAKSEFRDTPILGVVLNQVSASSRTYSKYYYSSYGTRTE